jgi:HK97 family phage prohead protease
MTEQKNFQFKLRKEPDDSGSFVGLASTYGNLDSVGDIVDPGAFTQTIAMRPQIPILWQHDPSEPIGYGRISDGAKGLQIEGSLILEDETAKKAYTLLKAGVIRGLSIGFQTIRDTVVNGVRHLKEVKLYEVSICTFPANELAQVTSVKRLRAHDAADPGFLRELKALAADMKRIAGR